VIRLLRLSVVEEKGDLIIWEGSTIGQTLHLLQAQPVELGSSIDQVINTPQAFRPDAKILRCLASWVETPVEPWIGE
jgi:hypothetical protein